MTSPFGWCEKSNSPSGDFPSETWSKDKVLKLKCSRNRDHNLSNPKNGESKYASGACQNHSSAIDSVLTLFPPRHDEIEASVSCLSTLNVSNDLSYELFDGQKEQNEVSKCNRKTQVPDEYQQSASPDANTLVSSLPQPVSMAMSHQFSFKEQTSENYFSESISSKNTIGFGFADYPSPKLGQVNRAKMDDERSADSTDIGFGFGFVNSKTSGYKDPKADDEEQLSKEIDFALLNLSERKESPERKLQIDSFGFQWLVEKPKPRKSKEIAQYPEIHSKNEILPLKNVASTEKSYQGDEKNERPRTPFSTSSSFVSGKFSEDVESPLAHNYPPISPFVLKNIGRNNSNMNNKQSASTKKIMTVCQQKEPIPLKLIFENLRELRKVGEGVYGEVYSGYFGSNPQARVYKIVAVEGKELVNGEKQKKFEEIVPEIIISQELSRLEDGVKGNFTVGFVKLYGARVCKGTYPESLIKAWKIWHKKHKSDNYCPDFSPGQLYVVFEFKFAGKDIEEFEFKSAKQSLSAVLQVAHTFAVGECAFGFEHRDAHWGNILVQETEEEFAAFVINGVSFKIPTHGIKVTVIDFTMSRIVNEHGTPVFIDISADEEQFLGTGDLQFDIYRMMREHNNDNWEQFSPKSNVLWIHYLADKMYFNGRYPKAINAEHSVNLRNIQRIKELILDFESCYEFSTNYLSQTASVGILK